MLESICSPSTRESKARESQVPSSSHSCSLWTSATSGGPAEPKTGLHSPQASLGLAGTIPTVPKSMGSVTELAVPCGPPDLFLSYRRHLGLPVGQEDACTRATGKSLVGYLSTVLRLADSLTECKAFRRASGQFLPPPPPPTQVLKTPLPVNPLSHHLPLPLPVDHQRHPMLASELSASTPAGHWTPNLTSCWPLNPQHCLVLATECPASSLLATGSPALPVSHCLGAILPLWQPHRGLITNWARCGSTDQVGLHRETLYWKKMASKCHTVIIQTRMGMGSTKVCENQEDGRTAQGNFQG